MMRCIAIQNDFMKQATKDFPFDFECDSFGSVVDADQILALATRRIQNPRQFSVDNLSTTKSVSGAIVRVFDHFSRHGILWETLAVTIDREDSSAEPYEFTHSVIRKANSSSLFKCLELTAESVTAKTGPRGTILFPDITKNERLQSISVHFCDGALALGDSLALKEMMATSQTLKELRLWDMTEFDQDLFCEGLTVNKSLEQLTLGLDRCNISDKVIADIISTVAGHPALTSFSLFVRGQFGPLSSQSMEELLSRKSNLLCLKLHDRGRDETRKLCLGRFAKGLRKCDSLKKLDVHNVFHSDESLSRLFVALAESSGIEDLWFWEKTSQKEFEKVIAMDRLPKPIRLYLDHKIIKDFPKHLEKMLHVHPEVRPFPFFGKKNASMERICDLNWHGRYLLMRHDNHVPLGIWAPVLEKANRNPCVIHQFLKAGILFESWV
ncbi:unnamed protein product [Cylindrotheca closterium]|uniref:Uncharacterized protein n=1 Tax=Cylindrotheca closterium TaxID=2856 RepID=A0AAD2CH59_9STRA|nr:unnamed protein product [Cylindrotheca closterium]